MLNLFILLLAGPAGWANGLAFCHEDLVTPRLKAMAWSTTNRLEPIFSDQRVISSDIGIRSGSWVAERESVVVPLKLQNDAETTLNHEYASWLPDQLLSFFESGGRFETSPASDSPFALWMIVPPVNTAPSRGRTGVLLWHGRPFVVLDPVTRAEYLIEIKGAGLPIGGFQIENTFKSVQGGMWDQHAALEYTRLNHFVALREGAGVLGLGHQSFTTPFGKQEILLRLTPGNLRLSYTGIAELSPSDEQISRIFNSVGRHVGELFREGYGAQTHFENFVADRGYERLFMTDYLDVLPLWNLPQDKIFLDEPDAIHMSTMVQVRAPTAFKSKCDAVVNFNEGALHALRKPKNGDPEGSIRASRVHPKNLLAGGLAAKILKNRIAFDFDPIADSSLNRLRKAFCADPNRLRVREAAIRLGHPDSGVASSALSSGLIRYGDGELSFKQLLNIPDFAKELKSELKLAFFPFQQFHTVDYGGVLASMPGLIEFKEHLEREQRLLKYALDAKANVPKLGESWAYLERLILFYEKQEMTDFERRICEHREEFLQLFYMPYHQGFHAEYAHVLDN